MSFVSLPSRKKTRIKPKRPASSNHSQSRPGQSKTTPGLLFDILLVTQNTTSTRTVSRGKTNLGRPEGRPRFKFVFMTSACVFSTSPVPPWRIQPGSQTHLPQSKLSKNRSNQRTIPSSAFPLLNCSQLRVQVSAWLEQPLPSSCVQNRPVCRLKRHQPDRPLSA